MRKMRKWRQYRIELTVCVAGLVFVNLPWIIHITLHRFAQTSVEWADHYGSFLAGYCGSTFSLFTFVLLISTLRRQTHSSDLQSFENKYYTLIKLHRDNMAEIGMKGDSGRRLFVLLLREYRCLYEIIKDIAIRERKDMSAWQLLHISYYCLFYGVGPTSSRMLKNSLSDFDKNFVESVENTLNSSERKEKVKRERGFPYIPFEGHQSRLGHYYRHLYQMVMYVHEASLPLGV